MLMPAFPDRLIKMNGHAGQNMRRAGCPREGISAAAAENLPLSPAGKAIKGWGTLPGQPRYDQPGADQQRENQRQLTCPG